MNLPKTYEASKFEDGIYDLWETSGVFKADPTKKGEHFSISMPPPNATGQLHIGHALGLTLQDILIRYNRMQGKEVLWLPGTDHAALATNAIMERQLSEEGTNKHNIGRDQFIERLQAFIDSSRGSIKKQTRAMGASCDWSRERYTLDNALNRCVNETFVKMFNDGLIYRGNRIVNWDPKLETTVSDDEVVYIEQKTKLYTFQYGPFQIATARPETKFGDKYVVMHPDDERYKDYKEGDTFTAEWINGPVKATVIKDEAIDPSFGTGVMTITPWHDRTDFEIAERHNLQKEQIISFHGEVLNIAGDLAGLSIEEARPIVVKKLAAKGLLVKEEDNYIHNIAVNDRGKGIIEPQIMLQWFVDVNKPAVHWKGKKSSLKQVLRDVIDEGDIKIIPSQFNKVYFHWIDNLQDWCISRQIWWGHRIPVWYQKEGDRTKPHVSVKPPEPADKWEQDPDTLDTWFSSALWTWSTLIDNRLADDYSISLQDILKQSPDYQAFHPTSVMETGWDILFFWVARMILATTYMTGEVPFKTVYLHGLVRHESGQKMSKSKPETMIDPLEVIPKYGTDALRLALAGGTSPGNDQRMSISKIIDQRNFCNKLWNIARYAESTIEPSKINLKELRPKTDADNWVLAKLAETIVSVTKDIDNYRFSDAYDKIYHFTWDDLADWYIEASKVEINESVLAYSLINTLKLAHPFAPFVTEVIWQGLSWRPDDLLISSTWPTAEFKSNKATDNFSELQKLIVETRYLSSALKLVKPTLVTESESLVEDNEDLIKQLARVGKLKTSDKEGNGLRLSDTRLKVWLEVDEAEIKKFQADLRSKLSQQEKLVDQLEKRLDNKAYVSNAPKEVVEESKKQLVEAKATLETIKQEVQRFA